MHRASDKRLLGIGEGGDDLGVKEWFGRGKIELILRCTVRRIRWEGDVAAVKKD